ncbi:MAG: PQQ-binding-like beta-propeller repeat protein, partial [Theionarchaea archaeon]|nr:PQQ-binding-like beta-propeller repeat protein [Theionarchaea archaeon]
NGKISCAVFRLLDGLGEDEELQAEYGKEIRWGCYPVNLDYEYCDRELSDDFPHSEPVVAPLEELGERHVVWDTAIPGILYPSLYHDGVLYTATERHIMAMDAETAQKLREVEIQQEGGNVENVEGDFLYHEGVVYCAFPPGVYAFNAETGEKMWEYMLDEESDEPLKIIASTGKILVWEAGYRGGGLVCLDAKSGDFLWKITEELLFLDIDSNTVLYKVRRKGNDYKPFYVLADITTGEPLWEKEISDFLRYRSDIITWSYYNGVLYVDREDQGVLVAVDLNTLEESPVYSHGKFRSDYEPGKLLQYCKVFEEGILLYFVELGETDWPLARWNTQMVFLDKEGAELWNYYYDYKGVGTLYSISGLFYGSWTYNPIEGAEIQQGILYVWRRRGALEAFNIQSGERLWESEVRDSLNSFDVLDNKIYLAAQDCRLYCMDAETGDILWEVKASDRYCTVTINENIDFFPYFPGSIICRCPVIMDAVEIGSGFLVTTGDRVIRVSVEEQRVEELEIEDNKEEPEIKGDKEGGLCLGTAILLLFVVSGSFITLLREVK